MRAFEYASPATKEQAISLLGSNWDEAEVLAGGTDLLSLMKDGCAAPKRLVNIKEIRELRGISMGAGGLRIGALATVQELLDNRAVSRAYPAITQAAEGITSPQIRSMGTIGGELCQRPRCWYYRAGYGLLATDEQGEPLVPSGDNRYHAILGNAGPAYFVHPSSLAPALIALGAKVRLFGPEGTREMWLDQFFTTPQTAGERETLQKPNEIVTEIIVPTALGVKSATYEVRQREALDWPLATASVALSMSGNSVRVARIVMGHVAPRPWRATEAEQFLAEKNVTEEMAQKAAELALSGARSLSRNGYKIQLARVAVKRAIMMAARGGRG